MAGPLPKQCEYHDKHLLAVTVGLDHTLTIEFPHSAWAEAFTNYVNGREYHRQRGTNAHVRRNKWRIAYLSLSRSVQRVEVKRDRDAVPGTSGMGLYFEFDDVVQARRWYENTKLWDPTTNPVKLFMPLEWEHGKFDRLLDIETSLRPADDDVVGPALGSRVRYA